MSRIHDTNIVTGMSQVKKCHIAEINVALGQDKKFVSKRWCKNLPLDTHDFVSSIAQHFFFVITSCDIFLTRHFGDDNFFIVTFRGCYLHHVFETFLIVTKPQIVVRSEKVALMIDLALRCRLAKLATKSKSQVNPDTIFSPLTKV